MNTDKKTAMKIKWVCSHPCSFVFIRGGFLILLFISLAFPAAVVASETGNRRVPKLSDHAAGVGVTAMSRCDTNYLSALGQLESGNNDWARGKAGEVSRFQCLKSVWREATLQPLAAATNAATAERVVLAVIWNRTGQAPADLTPSDFARAWHCPNARKLNREQRDYVRRFENLCNQNNK